MRGLETLAQLAEQDVLEHASPLQLPTSASVQDAPRFPYRGLMMDFARHFYPVSFIEHTMDAMEVGPAGCGVCLSKEITEKFHLSSPLSPHPLPTRTSRPTR